MQYMSRVVFGSSIKFLSLAQLILFWTRVKLQFITELYILSRLTHLILFWTQAYQEHLNFYNNIFS
jgi:hypothetical protein